MIVETLLKMMTDIHFLQWLRLFWQKKRTGSAIVLAIFLKHLAYPILEPSVWVRHSPEDVFGSKEAARQFANEQKFRPPPNIRAGSPYDIAPYTEHCCRVIANKPLDNSLSSRLVRWLLNSKYMEKF